MNKFSLVFAALAAVGHLPVLGQAPLGLDLNGLQKRLPQILPGVLRHLEPQLLTVFSKLREQKDIQENLENLENIETTDFPTSQSMAVNFRGGFYFYISKYFENSDVTFSVLVAKKGPGVGNCGFSFDPRFRLIEISCDHYSTRGRERTTFYDSQAAIRKIDYYEDPEVLPLDQIYGGPISLPEKRIKVGIVDSGVDYNHPSIAKHLPRRNTDRDLRISGYDFLDDDDLAFDIAMDDCASHGTGVADMIVRGRPEIELVPARYPRNGHLFKSIESVIEQGAQIVNLSLSVSEQLAPQVRRLHEGDLERAIRSFPKVLFVMAAGNEGRDVEDAKIIPQSLKISNLLVVAAVDRSQRLVQTPTWGSNYSKNTVHLAALGDDLRVAIPGGSTEITGGTSFAAPQVAGVMAKFRMEDPEATPEELIEKIREQLEPLEALKDKTLFGGVPRDLLASFEGASLR